MLCLSDCCCSSPTTNATNFHWNNYVRHLTDKPILSFWFCSVSDYILQQDKKPELQRYNFMIKFYTYIIIIIICSS